MAHRDEPDCLRQLYLDWTERMAANPQMSIADMRALFDEWHQASGEPTDVTYEDGEVGGVSGIWCKPLGADESSVVLYTHGGGFAVGSAASHRKLAAHLAKALGTQAFVLDYRRSPEHPFPAQIEDATAVYRALLADGYAASNIVTAGDSAGGNLAIASVLQLRADGTELPGAIIGFSPWLDMEHTRPTLQTNAATDGLVQKAVLEGMSGMFLGEDADTKRANPLANPLYADLSGMPRMYLNSGTHETLQDNAEGLAANAERDGVDVTLHVVDGQQHVFPFMAGRAKVADDEMAAVAAWYTGGK
ncbi:alpha/beta hydrolase [Cumulibacter soli]|uniref:alpha/beta hydrolase n=1 Tax=Cumulibacter soli TaxID=2546344 RepID=UPI00106847D4|nr:alpha/beta hydrolase [Cumulibacter soli]